MAKPGINEFNDITRLSTKPGITVLGISMPKIDGDQKPSVCLEASHHLISKITKSNVGATIVYGDGLYMYSDQSAVELKTKHQKLIEEHKSGYLRLIEKDLGMIPKAFSFQTWSQLMLDTQNFNNLFLKLKDIYKVDDVYKKYVKLDIKQAGKVFDNNSINYILEETLLDYLVAKGVTKLHNDYVEGHENWVLHVYHGKPHRSSIYLHQQNFFDLHNSKNEYEDSWYDMLNKKIYHYNRLDIETFDFSKK